MDDSEFDHFVKQSSRALLRSAYLLTGDRAQAEDLVQTVFTAAWRRWATVSGADSPRAYAQTMLVNAFLSTRRRPRWTREVITADPPELSYPQRVDLELRHTVLAALNVLPPRQRSALVLRYFCDLSVEDTAQAMNCSTGTVKSQTSKAIARLERTAALQDLVEDAS